MYTTLRSLVVVSILTCTVRCQDKQVCLKNSNVTDAHFVLLYDMSGGDDCSEIWEESQKLVDIARDTVDKINNSTQLLTDITLGLRVYSTCGDPGVTLKVATAAIPYSMIGRSTDFCGTSEVDDSIFLGFLGPGTSKDVLGLAQAISSTGVNIISPSATAQPLSEHVGIFRTAHPDLEQAKAFIDLILQLEWDYVVVVYSDDIYGRDGKRTITELAAENRICIPKTIEANVGNVNEVLTELGNSTLPTGVIFFGHADIGLNLINSYLSLQSGSRTLQWVVSDGLSATTLANNISSSITSDDLIYVINPTINLPSTTLYGQNMKDAVVLGAQALENTISSQYCGGSLTDCTVTGFTPFHKEFRSQLQQASFLYSDIPSLGEGQREVSFDEDGGPKNGEVAFDVFQLSYESVDLIGTYPTLVDIQKPSETSQCTEAHCAETCANVLAKDYIYIHGEYVIIVYTSVHNEGAERDNYKCRLQDTLLEVGPIRAQAAVNAVKKLKERFGSRGLDIGVLVLDTCYSAFKAAMLTTNLLSGQMTNICDDQNNCLDAKKVVGLVGDFSSGISAEIHHIAKQLKLIQISYGSTSPIFDVTEDYPYFLRTVPSDSRQAAGIAKLIERLRESNGNFQAVNLIYSDSIYGKSGGKAIEKELIERGFCVNKIDPLSLSENDFTSTIIAMKNRRNIKVTIYFGDEQPITGLLDSLSCGESDCSPIEKDHNDWWLDGNILVLSDAWSNREDLLSKYGSLTRGSLSFSIDANFSISELFDNIEDDAGSLINPWMIALQQKIGKCKVAGDFRAIHSRSCSSTFLADIDKQESFMVHMVKAIYSMVYGMKKFCIDDVNRNCDDLFDGNIRTSDFLPELKTDVKIPVDVSSTNPRYYPFDANGNGNVGYTVHNQQVRGTEVKYEQVFTFREDDKIHHGSAGFSYYDKNDRFIPSLSSTCPECTGCGNTVHAISSTTVAPPPPYKYIIPIAILILIIIGVGAFIFIRKLWKKPRDEEIYAQPGPGPQQPLSNRTATMQSSIRIPIGAAGGGDDDDYGVDSNVQNWLNNGVRNPDGSSDSGNVLYETPNNFSLATDRRGSMGNDAYDNQAFESSIHRNGSTLTQSVKQRPNPAPRSNASEYSEGMLKMKIHEVSSEQDFASKSPIEEEQEVKEDEGDDMVL